MSDYKELLERADRQAAAHVTLSDVVGPLAAALRAVIAELAATESERKAWENTAGCLRTDLEYMTRERDKALADSERSGELYQDIGRQLSEAIARAEQAEARLAEYERWQGDAEKVANDVAVKWISEYEPALAPIVSLGQSFVLQTLTAAALTSFAAQAAARQRDEDAKIAESRCSKDTDWDASYWNQACENIAVAIRMGEI